MRRRADAYMEVRSFGVGQGLFSVAEITADDHAPFRFVYDCGAWDRKYQAGWGHCDGFLSEVPPEPFDLLVISHFHADHVNDIPALLSHTGWPAAAWIPYLAPEVRLLYALTAECQRALSGGPPLGGSGRGLVADPRGFLQEGGTEVWQIGGPDDRLVGPPEKRETLPPERERRHDSERHEGGLALGPPLYWGRVGGFAAYSADACAPAVGHRPVVELVTWADPDFATLSLDVLAGLLADGDDPEMWRERLDDCVASPPGGLDPTAVARLADAIAERPLREVNRIYVTLTNQRNERSLFLMAKPVCFRCSRVSPAGCHCHGRGFLWCGDAPTGTLEELIGTPGPLQDRLVYVGAWQVPHHGSAYSFSPPLYERLPTGRDHCFVGYHEPNCYDHPHGPVAAAAAPYLLNQQAHAFTFHSEWQAL